MRLFKRAMQGRARWLVAFTLLLLAAGAVPVLADPPAGEQPPAAESGAGEEFDPSLLPDAADLAKAEKQLDEKEAEREAELNSPAAIAEREESALAYKDLESAGAVSDLLRSRFSDELASLEQDPARILTDATLERNLGNEGGAVIADEGQTELMEADIPAEIPGEDGDLEQVDFSLDATPEGFEPENPTTEILIPASPAEAISIEEGALSITQAGADLESSAHAFGEKDVIYPEVETDTDLLVSPLSSGVELFDQLRSPESPETLRFDLEIPAGAELRANGNVVEVWQDGKMTAFVSPPHAIDAQGTEVPVTMEVQGNTIVLNVPHREGEFAYPILVDPEVSTQNDWVNNAWYSYHSYAALEDNTFIDWNNNPGLKTQKTCIYTCFGGSGHGLFVSFPSNGYGLNQQAQWAYFVKGETTYLTGYLINPLFRDDHANCPRSSYPEPHDFDGIWSPTVGYYQLYTNRAPYGNASVYGNTAQSVKAMVFGLNSGNGVSLPCWRDIYAGGVATYMSDPDNPTLDTISGQPSGWFDDSKWSGVNVSAHDPGLGVSNVTLNIEGAPQVTLKPTPCYGTRDSPCPRDMSGTIPFNGDNFDEGLSLVKVNANDALSKSSGVQSFWAYVDSTAPEITLSGQLATVTEETEGNGKDPKEWDDLSLPVYNLGIKAKDGNPKYASNKERRSGVKNIEIYLDKKTEPEPVSWSANGSPCENCEKNVTFPMKLDGLAAGKHTLLVVALDQLNHKSYRDIEFEYIPATGMKDDYVMQHFALPDGQGNEAEEEHPTRPELAVNVMNGNLTYREKDVDVPGYAADLEVERFYNSQLPNSENTEWGDGWTLSQTPELEPEAGAAPKEAELLDTSGALEDDVQLPTETGKTKFNPPLQASLTKEAGGGYEFTDESGETATSIAFDSSGRTDELRTGDYAKIDYDYEAGKLDEIAVKDPGSASSISPAEEEALEYVPPAPTFKGVTIAPMGTKEGQLVKPTDAVMAANGDLFVVDPNLNWVQRFAQDGKFISKIGTKGSENGQFKEPTQVAIDSAGNLYVLDSGNVRIEKFKENGEFIKAFKLTIGKTTDGQVYGVGGMALDAKGNIYLADPGNFRVQKFNSNLEYVAKFGSYGTGNGQFTNPTNVDIGPGGTIWVTDVYQNTVTEFNEAGGFVRKFGSAGTGDGQFKGPVAIEIDSRGNVWVFDRGNGRVEQFNLSGKYLSKFGAGTGSKEEQFGLSPNDASGIVVDNKGGIWVVDPQNARVPKWGVPNYRPSWTFSFGTLGSGDGQMKSPADVDLAANGDLLVLDKGNNRVVRFDRSSLKFISKFGTTGTANGQFSAPNSLAVDPSGNIWVADSGNYRVEEFSDEGTFIRAFGSSGTGNGQFSKVEGIATDLKGNVYVADTYNKRVQVFDEEGKFLFKFGSAGSGLGQFIEANAIDIGPHGNVYVADWGANRIEKFNEKGEALLQFGSAGAGDGQFNRPDALEVDNKGNVWVGDQNNGRIELFNESGEYLTQFGAVGSGEGQFKFTYPMGIAVDSSGGIWITDVLNNRIQKWQVPNTDPPKPPEENDPSVDVSLSSGLVSSVEGEEAGTNTYAHTGELLTANKGPDGEVKYEYDTAGRLKKVTLPNGTYGSITYNTSYGRVSKVTVDPAGAAPAKSTSFAYSDEPRKTTVTPEGGTIISYDIGPDGSVVKWQDKNAPPTIDNISGSLYANRGKEVNTGVQNVVVKAHTPQGIGSIQILTNGTNLVDEATCTENEETTKVECEYVENEWVMETEDFAPGRLNLEAIVTDRKGEASTERFWVNIPPPPPPPPPPAGLPVKPKFKDILHFREEFGLEVWDPVSGESELNDRIFDSINGWTTEDPVSRASWERWGVPLRTPDVAELEYREAYIAHDGVAIEEWASAHAPSQYGGYRVNHAAGGRIEVGFTSNQDNLLAELKSQVYLMALSRIDVFPAAPTRSLAELESASSSVEDSNDQILTSYVTSVGFDEASNTVEVGASNVSAVESELSSLYSGASSLFTVTYATSIAEPFSPVFPGASRGRDHDYGRLLAGDRIFGNRSGTSTECTAGFGAWEDRDKKSNGESIRARFILTAGHCSDLGSFFRRSSPENRYSPNDWRIVGQANRTGLPRGGQHYETDAEAIRLEDPGLAPHLIQTDGLPQRINAAVAPRHGQIFCVSGAHSDRVDCGRMTGIRNIANEEFSGRVLSVVVHGLHTEGGDSGAPLYNSRTGTAIGLLWGRSGTLPNVRFFTPLVKPRGFPVEKAPGALGAPGMGNLHLITTP